MNLPTHAADETWVEVDQSDALLGHGLELVPEWEGELSDDESREDAADS